MPSRPNFTARLRAYTPLGAAGQVIPDQGISISSTPDGPTLQATISTVTYKALPTDLEVAVEVFDDVAQQWVEGRDSRFVVLTQDGDERDETQTTTLAGVGLMQWLMGKAALAGVAPLQAAANVEAAASTTTASVSGKTFTWGNHILGEGDRIRIVNSGKAKGLSTGSVYFVRNPGTSTFQVSQTQTGAIKSFGSSHSVSLQRVRTRAVFTGSQPFVKNEAISVWNANSNQNLTNGSQYYVVNPTGATIQIATKPGGIPIELVADSLTIYRYLDGARVFSSQTPGEVLGDPFLEARARGWGADASGTAQVFHSWTNAGDSNSLAWPARVDDPTVTGVAVSFQPGTSLWEMTTFLLDNGWAEFASHGRTIDLFAPLTGTDYSASRTVGGSATSVPKSVDLTDYATTEIVRGDGPVEVSATVPRSPWGVLEVYATASGVGSSAAAKSYGNTQLAQHQSASVGWTVTEQVSAAAWLPILDYQRGDWVSAVVGGSTQKLRVIQWSLQKNTDGTVTVSAVLQAKKRAILKKVAKAAKRANGGRAALTTSTTPKESDARKAAVPANLAVAVRTTAAADKSATGTLTASWSAVTTDQDGNDLAGASYELSVRTDGQQTGTVVTTTTALQADLPPLPAGQTVAVSVRAISGTGTYGEATPELEYVVATPGTVPDPPSAPVVTSTLGSITVTWDGNLVDAIDGPHAPTVDDSLAYVQVQRSTDQQTWTTEAQTLPAAGYVVDLGLTVGSTYYYQLVAVSQLGVSSAPSPINSAAVVGVNTAQIDAEFTQQVSSAASAASNAQQVASQASSNAGTALNTANSASTAASTAQTAAQNAQTAANGKNRITYAQAAPTSSQNGTVAGDQWFVVDASGHITSQLTWTVPASGSASWTPTVLTGSVITNLDAGQITTGTLSAARLAANSITTNLLAVSDFTNLYPDPTMARPYNGPTPLSFAYTGTDAPGSGNAWVIADRDNIGSQGLIQVHAGDAFYVELDVKTVQGSLPLTAGLWVVTANGGTDPNFTPYGTLNTIQGSGQVLSYGNGWTRQWWRFTIPTNATALDHGTLYLQILQSPGQPYSGQTAYAVANPIVRRLGGGNLIVDGSISTTKLAATAIDAMTITGATFRTASTATTAGGVQMDSTGLHGYNASGAATFSLDTQGNLGLTGTVNATGGSISGALSIGANGGIYTSTSSYPRSRFDTYGLTVDSSSGFRMTAGDIDNSHSGLYWNSNNSTVAEIYVDTSGNLTTAVPSVNFSNANMYASGLRNSATTGQSMQPGAAGSNSIGFVIINSAGQMGMANGYLQSPDSYSRVENARAVYINSSGTFGTTSSSRRTKNLHRHLKMDDNVLEKWLGLATWEFEYKPEIAPDSPGIHHGLVAEEVEDAGFTQLIYYDERVDSETHGRVDGFAYERMGVYNHMALKRLYRRLQDAERQLSELTGKA